eukprot:TRINITY_DN41772_c0_g1_i1.p1 TRINITY_DN41772_c0_g1~~TRINITY_DN41772_c0_g1_i1.p1  ORF type:complete len:402 (+),score=56.42 TRINITY_DN41772_c0_g1_i1:139-1206(+)
METIGVIVSCERVGAVIGKFGNGLKQAREQSGGCKLDVLKGNEGCTKRRVNLVGDVNQISAAFGVVAQKAFQEESDGLPAIMVPSEKVGSIVGRGGENLRRVREVCGIQVHVERTPVVDPDSGVEERLVTLQGSNAALGPALSMALAGSNLARGFVFGPGLPSMSPGLMGAMGMGMLGASTMFLSGVRPVSSDREQVQLHLYIPDKLVGAIVGKEGATIKQTAASSGCICSVTSRDSGPRRVVILGTYYQAALAQRTLFQQMQEATTFVASEELVTEAKVVILIRKKAAGAVVGKQGLNLTSIREQSKAKIKLDREEVMSQRPCTISGPLESVLLAEQLIHDIVRAVPGDIDGPI